MGRGEYHEGIVRAWRFPGQEVAEFTETISHRAHKGRRVPETLFPVKSVRNRLCALCCLSYRCRIDHRVRRVHRDDLAQGPTKDREFLLKNSVPRELCVKLPLCSPFPLWPGPAQVFLSWFAIDVRMARSSAEMLRTPNKPPDALAIDSE